MQLRQNAETRDRWWGPMLRTASLAALTVCAPLSSQVCEETRVGSRVSMGGLRSYDDLDTRNVFRQRVTSQTFAVDPSTRGIEASIGVDVLGGFLEVWGVPLHSYQRAHATAVLSVEYADGAG